MRWPADSFPASREEGGRGREEDCWKEAVERAERDCQGMSRSMSCITVGDLKSVERKVRMTVTYGLRTGDCLKAGFKGMKGFLERIWLRVVKVTSNANERTNWACFCEGSASEGSVERACIGADRCEGS